MKKPPATLRLTRAAWNAFKRQEAAERMELVRRVEEGELAPWQANEEASIFKGRIPSVTDQPINYGEAARLLRRSPTRSRSNARKRTQTVQA